MNIDGISFPDRESLVDYIWDKYGIDIRDEDDVEDIIECLFL